MAAFDQIYAVDPNNSENVAENGVISIYAPGTRTLLTLKTVTGGPLENPLQLNGRGFGPAFLADGYTEVAWEAIAPGEVFQGTFKSYTGVLEKATEAVTAAQSAASTAGAEAAVAAEAELTQRIDAGEFNGKDGSNVVPTAQAIATEIQTPGTPANTALSATIAGAKTEFFDRFSNHPDGAFPTALSDSGHQWLTIASPTAGSAGQIIGGKLTNTVNVAGKTGAVYAERNMGGPVTRVGARFTLAPGGAAKPGEAFDYGGIEIGSWKEAMSSNYPTVPNSACHLVVYPDYWNYGVWDRDTGNMLESLKTVYFKKRLATDSTTVHEIDVFFEGDTATIKFPDGSIGIVTDPRIASRAGDFAQWEVYQADSAVHTKASFVEVWASSAQVKPYAFSSAASTLQTLKKVNERILAGPVAKTHSDTTSTLYTAPTTAGDVATGGAAVTFRMPDSGRAHLEVQAFLEMSAAAQMFWVLRDATTDRLTLMVASTQTTGLTRAGNVMTGTPNTLYTLQLRHFATVANAGGIRCHSATGRPIVLRVTPLEAN